MGINREETMGLLMEPIKVIYYYAHYEGLTVRLYMRSYNLMAIMEH